MSTSSIAGGAPAGGAYQASQPGGNSQAAAPPYSGQGVDQASYGDGSAPNPYPQGPSPDGSTSSAPPKKSTPWVMIAVLTLVGLGAVAGLAAWLLRDKPKTADDSTKSGDANTSGAEDPDADDDDKDVTDNDEVKTDVKEEPAKSEPAAAPVAPASDPKASSRSYVKPLLGLGTAVVGGGIYDAARNGSRLRSAAMSGVISGGTALASHVAAGASKSMSVAGNLFRTHAAPTMATKLLTSASVGAGMAAKALEPVVTPIVRHPYITGGIVAGAAGYRYRAAIARNATGLYNGAANRIWRKTPSDATSPAEPQAAERKSTGYYDSFMNRFWRKPKSTPAAVTPDVTNAAELHAVSAGQPVRPIPVR